jgi:hypothetical protein
MWALMFLKAESEVSDACTLSDFGAFQMLPRMIQ